MGPVGGDNGLIVREEGGSRGAAPPFPPDSQIPENWITSTALPCARIFTHLGEALRSVRLIITHIVRIIKHLECGA
jgi:hypothetical protein